MSINAAMYSSATDRHNTPKGRRTSAKGTFVSYPSLREHLAAYTKLNPTTGCIEWTGAVDKDGYGKLTNNYRSLRPHRVAYELHHDVVLNKTQQINHKCHNPICCNPEHMYLGTQLENMRDKVAADRQAKGEKNAQAKVSSSQVLEIRRRAQGGETIASIAMDYSLSKSGVDAIVARRTWKWLSDGANDEHK